MQNNALASIMQNASCRMYVDERDKTHQLCIVSDRCIFPPALFVSDGIQSVCWAQRVLIQLTVLCHTARGKHSFKCSVLNIAGFLCAPAAAPPPQGREP